MTAVRIKHYNNNNKNSNSSVHTVYARRKAIINNSKQINI